MSDRPPAGPRPSEEQIAEVARDVWSAFAATELRPGTAPAGDGAGACTARVGIDGAWHGCVVVRCSPGLARAAAAQMFARPVGQVSAEDVTDALGELTNMIGGNLKSLLPAPSRLSLPTVSAEPAAGDGPPGAEPVGTVTLEGGAGRLTVEVWQGTG